MILTNEWSVSKFTSEETSYFPANQHGKGILCEVQTKLLFNSTKEISTHVAVKSETTANHLAVALDNYLFVFELDGYELKTRFKFESEVACLKFSPHGEFIIVVEASNQVSVVHVCTGILLMNKLFESGLKIIGCCFTSPFLELVDLLLITDHGNILRLSNLNFKHLDSAALNQNASDIKNLLSKLKLSYDAILVDLQIQPNAIFDCQSILVISDSANCLHFIAKDYQLQFKESLDLKFCNLGTLKHITYVASQPFLYMLFSDGLIYVMNTINFDIIRKLWNEYNDSFVISEDDGTIAVLKKNEGKAELQIKYLYNNEVGFNQVFLEGSILLKGYLDCETIHVLEPQKDTLLMSTCGSSYRLVKISKTSPSHRLDSLLRKHWYIEAEAFAKSFSLDLDLVYMKESSFICSNLGLSSSNLLSEEDISIKFERLLHCINLITNYDFIHGLGVNFSLNSYSRMWKYLLCVMEKLRNGKFTFKDDTLTIILTKLLIFNKIYPPDEYKSKWTQFCTKAPDEIICELFLSNMTSEACQLFNLCLKFGLLELDEVKLANILSNINVSSDCLSCFKTLLFPHLFTPKFDGLSVVEKWIQDKILKRGMDQEYWVETVISICISVLEIYDSSQMLLYFPMETSYSPYVNISNLIESLRQLQYLSSHYDISLPISIWVSLPKVDIVSIFLDLIQNEKKLIEAKSFFDKYCLQNYVDPSSALYSYIKLILLKVGKGESTDYQFPWEVKVSIILSWIPEVHLQKSLFELICEQAPVPWSSHMEYFVEKTVPNESHCFSKILKQQRQKVEQKLILMKYADDPSWLSIFTSIEQCISFILAQNMEFSLVDALKLAAIDKIDPLLVYLNWFDIITMKDSNEFKQKLPSLSDTLANELILEITPRTAEFLQRKRTKYISQTTKQHHLTCLKEFYISFISMLRPEVNDLVRSTISYLEKMLCLQEMFNVYLNLHELSRADVCTKKFFEYLQEVKGDVKLEFVLELGRLLGLSKDLSVIHFTSFLISIRKKKFRRIILDNVELLRREHISTESSDLKLHLIIDFLNYCSEENELSDSVFLCASSICSSISPYLKDNWNMWVLCWLTSWLSLINLGVMSNDVKNLGYLNVYTESKSPEAELMGRSIMLKLTIKHIKTLKESGRSQPGQDISIDNNKMVFYDLICSLPQFVNNHQLVLTLSKVCGTDFAIKDLANPQHKLLSKRSICELCFNILMDEVQLSDFDHTIVTGCAILLSSYFLRALKKYWTRFTHNYQAIKNVCLVGFRLAILCDEQEFEGFMKDLYGKAVWALVLKEMNVEFNAPLTNLDTILPLMKNHLCSQLNVPLSMLQAFGLRFNIPLEGIYEEYFRNLFFRWSKSHKCTPELKKSFEQLISKFSGDKLHEMLISYFKRVSWYNYELSEFLLGQVDIYLQACHHIVPANDMMVKFTRLLEELKDYERQSEPLPFEWDSWKMLYNEVQLPKIAFKRIPLQALNKKECLWKIIKSEVDVYNINKWIAIGEILNAIQENVYFFAAHNTIEKIVADFPGRSDWNVWSCYSKVLNEIKLCVNNIPSSAKACTLGHSIISNFVPGLDKVMISSLWSSLDPANENALRTYRQLATMHALYQHRIGLPQYLENVLKPTELLLAIFRDVKVHLKDGLSKEIYPCVKEIAKVNDIDLLVFEMDMIDKWFTSAAENFVDLEWKTADGIRETQGVEDLLFRVSYLLHMDQKSKLFRHLQDYVYNQSNKSARFRLLCFLSLYHSTSPDLIKDDLTMSIKEAIDFGQTLTIIAKLETLGYNFTVSSFNKCDKLNLCTSIVNDDCNPRTYLFIIDIVVRYEIRDDALWSSLLKNLIKYRMDDSLAALLRKISHMHFLYYRPEFIEAWSHVLTTPLQSASSNSNGQSVSSHDIKLCLEGCHLLIECPVLHAVNFDDFVKYLGILKSPVLGLAYSHHLPPDVAKTIKEQAYMIEITDEEKLKCCQLISSYIPLFKCS